MVKRKQMFNEIKLEDSVRGTRIISGDLAKKRRKIINNCISIVENNGFNEIVLPSLEQAHVYADKAGPEILEQMYVFPDKKDRRLCLRPEGTATCQLIAREKLKLDKNVCLWYATSCWRYERPQEGRYREFTQFGVEILNPADGKLKIKSDTQTFSELLLDMAIEMVKFCTNEFVVNKAARRGLAYYIGDGFEISCPKLGAQKQVCGGGSYKEGVGFALGIDRLMLL